MRVKATDLDQAAVGTVEKLGPATITKIKDGSAITGSPSSPSSTPAATTASTPTTHHPWMRELVILRDGHCVFPGCQVDARSCDLDHITPYAPNGPPGQTRLDNLACLCRRRPPAPKTASDSGATSGRPTASCVVAKDLRALPTLSLPGAPRTSRR